MEKSLVHLTYRHIFIPWRWKQYFFLRRRSVPTRLWIHIQEDVPFRISIVFLMWGTDITEMRDSRSITQTTVSLSHFRMPIKMQVFWVITSWIPAYNFQTVGGNCCCHLQSFLRVLWRRRQQDSSPNSRISCYKSIPIFRSFKVCCYALPVIVTFLVFLRNMSVDSSNLCTLYDFRMLI
jgi:hypothetical protein